MDKFKGLSSATLKNIAIISMLIDHLGHVLYGPFLVPVFGKDLALPIYIAMRIIGRIAFIVFAFQVGQAIVYTKSRKRYLISLGAFAIISEFPFDLALRSKFIDITHQNTFVTLFIGALCLVIIDKYKDKKTLCILASILGIVLAESLRSDYGGAGVLLIILLYLFRNNIYYGGVFAFACFVALEMGSGGIRYVFKHPDEEVIVTFMTGVMNYTLELFGIVGIWLLNFYNGKKGKGLNKWFYYMFYPAHLLLLYAVLYCVK